MLNRTAGPPDNDITSFEVMSGEQPKIMGILPFGCRANVVRPKEFVVKSRIDAHAWVGAKLGRSSSSPGTYNIWVPSTGRVHCSSDIYFTERFFPHRPAGNHYVGLDLPAAAAVDASQPPGIPIAVPPAAPAPPPAAAPAPPPDAAWRDSVHAEAVRLVEAAMLPTAPEPPSDPPPDDNAPPPPPPPPRGHHPPTPHVHWQLPFDGTAADETADDVTAIAPAPY